MYTSYRLHDDCFGVADDIDRHVKTKVGGYYCVSKYIMAYMDILFYLVNIKNWSLHKPTEAK